MINRPPIRTPIIEIRKDSRNADVITTTKGWGQFFSQVFTICLATSQSGITANRPVRTLYIGRFYFDTTLGKPIWYDGAGWVDATGTSV